ncbi:MAG: sugar ABC transporter substrate-binding protein [Lachnospiraceae bacterium]|nr:sugar ABC transporter substrate-binding protein [Lachnospiraceae bacterium]
MKKRILSVLMGVTLVASMFAGCGSSENKTEASEDKAETATEDTAEDKTETTETTAAAGDFECKPYSIALPFPESGLTSFEIARSNFDLLESQTNGEIINAASDLTPDGVLSFVESQVAAGVSGLVICPPSDSVLPTVTQLCEEAGVYWGITLRSISDPEIKAMVEASPYYVGNCYEDEETAGYTCGKWMGDAGYKKIAIISQAKGDTTCDTREVGLGKACEELGIEIVGESRGHAQASDTTAATESFLAANPDLDAIFFVGSACTGAHEACIKAIQDAGRDDVKVVTIDFPDAMTEDFETGVLAYSYAQVCLTYDPYISIIKVVNAIQGTPIGDDGKFTSNTMAMYGIDSVEAAKEYQAIAGNPKYLFYDEEELKSFYKWENPDLNEQTLQEMIDSYKVTE